MTGWRRWVIVLWWIGLALVAADLVSDFFAFETTHTDLVRGFNLVRNILFWVVGPIAVWLYAVPGRGKKASSVSAELVLLLTLLWVVVLMVYLPLSFVFEDAMPWETKQVLYVSAENPHVQVVKQSYEIFVGSSTIYRVVKLTPVLGLWQLVEPVDTTRFDTRGWQRQ